MEVQLMGTLRPIIEDSFPDGSTGEIISYKQLQMESEDEQGRISIDRISIPKTEWETIGEMKKLVGSPVKLPCQITKNQNGMRTVLSGKIIPLGASQQHVKTA
jgi:hypothetical protein